MLEQETYYGDSHNNLNKTSDNSEKLLENKKIGDQKNSNKNSSLEQPDGTSI
jgi:hypothetical protein